MTNRWTTMLLASLLTAGWVHHANAQPSAPPPTQEPVAAPDDPPEIERYGVQLLAGDAASIAAGFAVAVGTRRSEVGFLTFASGYLLASPIIHLSHRNPRNAALSVVLRAGLPTLGISIALSSADSGGVDLGAALLAMLLGLTGTVTAAAIDWSVLGHSVPPASTPSKPVLVPRVSAAGDGSLQIGVQGRF